MLKKIVIIGPESTGKSVLSAALAQHYQSSWAPEFAREFLLNLKRPYTCEDLYPIALGQLDLAAQAKEAASCLLPVGNKKFFPYFIDTDLYVIKVWSEYVFNKCDNKILNLIVESDADLYLLCAPDLPWEPDRLREYPDEGTRLILFEHYKEAMINQPVPWVTICGEGKARLKLAIDAVDVLLQ